MHKRHIVELDCCLVERAQTMVARQRCLDFDLARSSCLGTDLNHNNLRCFGFNEYCIITEVNLSIR